MVAVDLQLTGYIVDLYSVTIKLFVLLGVFYCPRVILNHIYLSFLVKLCQMSIAPSVDLCWPLLAFLRTGSVGMCCTLT